MSETSEKNESMSTMSQLMEHNKVGTAGFVILLVFIIGALASVYGIMSDVPRIGITISTSMFVLIAYLGLYNFKTVLKISIAVMIINAAILVAGLISKDFYETTRIENAASTQATEMPDEH